MKLTFVIALAACGRVDFVPSPATDGARSGTRLKLVWDDFADGARTQVAIFDAVRGERCELLGIADGRTVCVPADFSDAYFTDASCTQPVAEWNEPSCPLPGYVLAQGACGEITGIYPSAGASAAAAYYQRVLEACNGPFTTGAAALYAVAAPVSPDDLAEVTLSSPSGSSRVGARYYTSADGFAVAGPSFDRALDTACSPFVSSDGAICPPNDITSTSLLLDAGCTQHLAEVLVGCGTPAFAGYTDQGSCTSHYAKLGAPIDPAPSTLYGGAPGMCTAYAPDPRFVTYSVGDPVDVAQLARAPEPDASARLWPIYFTSSDGYRLRDAAMYDSLLDVECNPGMLADGSTRCIPAGIALSRGFSDAGCGVPLDVVFAPASTCPGAQGVLTTFAIDYESTTCSLVERVYTVGAAYPGTVYAGSPGNCVAQTGQAFAVSAADPTAFVAYAQVTDP